MNAFNTKVSKSKQGSQRFPKHDKPVNNEVKTYTLSSEELEYYRQKGKIEMGGKTMKPEQAQELEKVANESLDEQLQKLEQEVAELSQTNNKLKQELGNLLDRYNKLSLDYETAEQVRYDLTRTEGQRDQLKLSLKETEEVLTEETNKREALERLVRLYV